MPTAIIIDPHTVFAEGLQSLIQSDPKYTVPAIADTGRRAVDLVDKHRPDLVTLETSLPDITGMETAARIRRKHPAIKILALAAHAHPPYIHAMLRAGAAGYVTKSNPYRQVAAAIKAILRGGLYFSPDLAEVLTSRDPAAERLNRLTPQQLKILTLIAQGHHAKAIADQVHLSLKTVHHHRRRIMTLLKTPSEADLTRLAIKTGLVNL